MNLICTVFEFYKMKHNHELPLTVTSWLEARAVPTPDLVKAVSGSRDCSWKTSYSTDGNHSKARVGTRELIPISAE